AAAPLRPRPTGAVLLPRPCDDLLERLAMHQYGLSLPVERQPCNDPDAVLLEPEPLRLVQCCLRQIIARDAFRGGSTHDSPATVVDRRCSWRFFHGRLRRG